MILLDFYSGSHGHFLEYVINAYIFRGPRVDRLFTDLGTCHAAGNSIEYRENKKVSCGHNSESKRPITAIPESIIRIIIDNKMGNACFQINVDCRAGDIPVEAKLAGVPDSVKNSRVLLRNNYFSKINSQEFGYPIPTKSSVWQHGDQIKSFYFPMEALFDLHQFYSTMKELAGFLEHTWNPDASLNHLWHEFIELNHGVQAWKKCTDLLDKSLSGVDYEFTCNAWEEALLNWMLTQSISIYDGPLFENEKYPTNTLEIHSEINKFLSTVNTRKL